MKQRRALILYATMTRNTEKVATWFKETFEYYGWETTLFKLSPKAADWEGMQEKLYFDDYDVVCLGSPIVAGAPLQIVMKVLSLGGGGALEKEINANVEKGEAKFTEKMEDNVQDFGKKKRIGARWRRNEAPYRGIIDKSAYRPLGVVFTTYGGGFYGSNEAKATLETLKLYLEINAVDVKGVFACCGREFGPAGLEPGQIPETVPGVDVELAPPMVYNTADGGQFTGSFFHHAKMWEKPGPREEYKARALIADMVEDYFCTNDGERRLVLSEYISIS